LVAKLVSTRDADVNRLWASRTANSMVTFMEAYLDRMSVTAARKAASCDG
jgi:hypothetical protein